MSPHTCLLRARRALPTLTLGVALATSACGGDSSTAPRGSIALELSGPTASVQPGETATVGIVLTRAGFAGEVTPSIEGLPAGVTASFTPTSYLGATEHVTLTLAAAASATTGTSALTVHVRGSGLVASAPLTLAVSTTGGSTNHMTLSFCADATPDWLAFQSGDGEWTRVVPVGGNVFSFTSTSSRVGIAYVFAGFGAQLKVLYATVAELAPLNGTPCIASGGDKQLLGTFAGLNTSLGVVSAGSSLDYNDASFPRFALLDLPARQLDLVGMRADVDVDHNVAPNRVLLRRNVDLASTGTTPALDFSGGEAQNPASAPLTVANVAGDSIYFDVIYRTPNGTNGILQYLATTGSATMYGMPLALVGSGDMHVLEVEAAGTSNDADRGAYAFFRNVAPLTVTLGAPLAPPTITSTTSGSVARPRAQVARQADYGTAIVASFGQSDRVATVLQTTGWAGAGTTWDVTVPDLSAVAGWSPDWAPLAGQSTGWLVTALRGMALVFGNTPASGTIELFAARGNVFSTGPAATIVAGPRSVGAMRATRAARTPAAARFVAAGAFDPRRQRAR